MLGQAADLLNRRYNTEELAAILARVTLGIGHHKDNNAYICSEFVDLCFKAVGITKSDEPEGADIILLDRDDEPVTLDD